MELPAILRSDDTGRYPIHADRAFDFEVFPNGWFCVITDTATLRVIDTVRSHESDAIERLRILEDGLCATWNGPNYDVWILAEIMQGGSVDDVYQLSCQLVSNNRPKYSELFEAYGFPLYVLDIMPHYGATGRAGLKTASVRQNLKRVISFADSFTEELAEDKRAEAEEYCRCDVEDTILLYRRAGDALAKRQALSIRYNMDLRNKTDSDIAELVLVRAHLESDKLRYQPIKLDEMRGGCDSEVQKEVYRLRDLAKQKLSRPGAKSFDLKLSPYVDGYENRQLSHFTSTLRHSPCEIDLGDVDDQAQLIVPGHTDASNKGHFLDVAIGDKKYGLGRGGLHSEDEPDYFVSGEGGRLYEIDVTSMYPSIILELGLEPSHWRPGTFLPAFRKIVEERIEAKRRGDDFVAGMLKIVINSAFGRLSYKHSALFSPELLFTVTLNGQLFLLKVIEELNKAGIPTLTANTDGLALWVTEEAKNKVEPIIKDAEKRSGLLFEGDWLSKYLRRDCNTYITVKTSGKQKAKGWFAKFDDENPKNPSAYVITHAVINRIMNGTPVEESIRGYGDISGFLYGASTNKSGKSGAVNVYCGEQRVGYVNRWYVPVEGEKLYRLMVKTGSTAQVPNGAKVKLVPELPESVPNDVDFGYYIDAAHTIISKDYAHILARDSHGYHYDESKVIVDSNVINLEVSEGPSTAISQRRVTLERLPEPIKRLKQFIVASSDKRPYDPATGGLLNRWQRQDSWMSLGEAQAIAEKIGGYPALVLSAAVDSELTLACADLDSISNWAEGHKWLRKANTWAEKSMSGNGLHVFFYINIAGGQLASKVMLSKLPFASKNSDVRTDAHYVALTGHKVNDTPETLAVLSVGEADDLLGTSLLAEKESVKKYDFRVTPRITGERPALKGFFNRILRRGPLSAFANGTECDGSTVAFRALHHYVIDLEHDDLSPQDMADIYCFVYSECTSKHNKIPSRSSVHSSVAKVLNIIRDWKHFYGQVIDSELRLPGDYEQRVATYKEGDVYQALLRDDKFIAINAGCGAGKTVSLAIWAIEMIRAGEFPIILVQNHIECGRVMELIQGFSGSHLDVLHMKGGPSGSDDEGGTTYGLKSLTNRHKGIITVHNYFMRKGFTNLYFKILDHLGERTSDDAETKIKVVPVIGIDEADVLLEGSVTEFPLYDRYQRHSRGEGLDGTVLSRVQSCPRFKGMGTCSNCELVKPSKYLSRDSGNVHQLTSRYQLDGYGDRTSQYSDTLDIDSHEIFTSGYEHTVATRKIKSVDTYYQHELNESLRYVLKEGDRLSANDIAMKMLRRSPRVTVVKSYPVLKETKEQVTQKYVAELEAAGEDVDSKVAFPSEICDTPYVNILDVRVLEHLMEVAKKIRFLSGTIDDGHMAILQHVFGDSVSRVDIEATDASKVDRYLLLVTTENILRTGISTVLRPISEKRLTIALGRTEAYMRRVYEDWDRQRPKLQHVQCATSRERHVAPNGMVTKIRESTVNLYGSYIRGPRGRGYNSPEFPVVIVDAQCYVTGRVYAHKGTKDAINGALEKDRERTLIQALSRNVRPREDETGEKLRVGVISGLELMRDNSIVAQEVNARLQTMVANVAKQVGRNVKLEPVVIYVNDNIDALPVAIDQFLNGEEVNIEQVKTEKPSSGKRAKKSKDDVKSNVLNDILDGVPVGTALKKNNVRRYWKTNTEITDLKRWLQEQIDVA